MSPDPADLFPSALPPSPLGVYRGVFTKTLADDTSTAEVIIPAIDTVTTFDGARWQPRGAADYPAKGDDCLVAFDEESVPWVVCWWPAS